MLSRTFQAGIGACRVKGQAVRWAVIALGVIADRLIFGGTALAVAGNPFHAGRFNAVDGVAGELMVAVGNHGTIFQALDGKRVSHVASHTKRDLLNVQVSSPDFAVAVGQGIVLRWDGMHWKPIVHEARTVSYSQAWISPDKKLILYGGGVSKGNYRVCPWLPDATVQPFCRQFDAPMRAVCGHGDVFYILLANGDVHRVNSALIGKDGGFEPAYTPPSRLHLTAAWLPDQACDLHHGLPEAFAVQSNGSLVHFDGKAWHSLQDVPERTITGQGISGFAGPDWPTRGQSRARV